MLNTGVNGKFAKQEDPPRRNNTDGWPSKSAAGAARPRHSPAVPRGRPHGNCKNAKREELREKSDRAEDQWLRVTNRRSKWSRWQWAEWWQQKSATRWETQSLAKFRRLERERAAVRIQTWLRKTVRSQMSQWHAHHAEEDDKTVISTPTDEKRAEKRDGQDFNCSLEARQG